MPSKEHEDIVALMRAQPAPSGEVTIADQRAGMEAMTAMFPAESGVTSEEVDVGGVPSDWVSEDGSDTGRVVLYLHGGGYVMGSRNTHRGLAGRIAKAANARVLLPDYRLAPEHPFPAAVEDAVTCWRWLLDEGNAPENMAIAGDSAGGGLTLATLLKLKADGLPLPACAVGLSPWTDLEGTGPSAEPGAVDDPMITIDGLRKTGRDYAEGDLRNPLAAPHYGDPAGLPPLLIQVGTREVLLSDSERFAEAARAAGVDVTLEVEDGLIHVWQAIPTLPEAQSAVERIGAFIAARCGE